MRVFGNRAILLVVNREAGQVDDVESRGAFEVRRERDQALVVVVRNFRVKTFHVAHVQQDSLILRMISQLFGNKLASRFAHEEL